jgi:5-methylcytosine-specific restriction endonuclease McrA
MKKWWKDPEKRRLVGLKISEKMRSISSGKKEKSLMSEVRSSYQYHLWRKGVLIRDNYTCVECNRYGRYKKNKVRIEAHHTKAVYAIIKGMKLFEEVIKDKDIFDINNGKALCLDCHRKTDNYGSKAKKQCL